MRILKGILLVFVLSACASIPKAMVGTYGARSGDFVVVKGDGRVFWSPVSKSQDKLSLVGTASRSSSDPLRMNIAVPPISGFPASSITYSSDYSRVTLDWGFYAANTAVGRSTEFEKSPGK